MLVSKKSIVLFFTLLIMLMPSYFADMIPGYKLLANIFAVVGVMFLVQNKIAPSKYTGLIIAYYVYLLFVTGYNGNLDHHDVISTAKMIVVLLMVEYFMRYRYKSGIHIILFITGVFVVADLISVVAFPNGIYQTATVWNEWSTSYAAQWILGNKNNRIVWYLVAILLVYLNNYYERTFKSGLMLYGMILISEIAVISVKSSTSTAVITIVSIFILLATIRGEKLKLKLNVFVLNIAYIVLLILVLVGMTDFLSPVVEKLFNKELTFSNRTYAWSACIIQILEKPILGWGMISTDQARDALGSLAYVNAHNQWLQILWQGGIVQLFLFVILLSYISSRINKINDIRLNVVAVSMFFAFLVEMIFEVEMGSTLSWILLLLMVYMEHYDAVDSLDESREEISKNENYTY